MNAIQRSETPPREATRMMPFELRRDEGEPSEDDGRTLDGYAAVFGSPTIIDSWEGRFKEEIAPGSMKKSFREKPPVIQFDHGKHPLIGSIPIARLDSIAEEVDPVRAPNGGAHVVGRLHDNWLIQPIRDAIASESINGMSFRFEVVREEWFEHDGKRITDQNRLFEVLERSWREDVPEDELPLRRLKELKVRELGPVVFPAYGDTHVGVRSQVIDLARLDDPEQRSLLARAVLMADQAEQESAGDSLPRSTDTSSAAEHDEPQNETSRSTSPRGDAAEHEPRFSPGYIRMWRDKARDTVISIDNRSKEI